MPSFAPLQICCHVPSQLADVLTTTVDTFTLPFPTVVDPNTIHPPALGSEPLRSMERSVETAMLGFGVEKQLVV